MTTQNLLTGLKELLNNEFEKNKIMLDNPTSGYRTPRVYIGFLPPNTQEEDFPHVVITPPLKAEDDEVTQTLPLTIYCGVKTISKDSSTCGFMDILTLVERTKAILMTKNIVAEAFRRTGKVTWGVDLLDDSPDYSIGEINLTYETVTSYQETIYRQGG